MIRLKRQLDRVVKTRELHRASRRKVPFPLVALVGYTNAGKSTLFNRMTGADVLAKDMLFATLDPTMRGIVLPSGRKIIASDTVGFISDLPTQLVAAFRATLEEVLEADLVVHVRDISHPESGEQAQDVADILQSLGVGAGTPQLEVWNKLDLVDPSQREALTALSSAELALRYDALVVPTYGIRRADGGFDLIVEAPVPHSTAEAMTQALNDSLEAQVMAHMDQWLWTHRRWKAPRRKARQG